MAHAKEPGTELRIGVVIPSPEAGSGLRLQLANATHLSTQMRCLQIDRDPVRVQDLGATIFQALDMDQKVQYVHPSGRPINMIEEGKPIEELF